VPSLSFHPVVFSFAASSQTKVVQMSSVGRASKRFSLVLIKPSHYDDDGYVIQWFRSAIPSNTLAVLNGLALD